MQIVFTVIVCSIISSIIASFITAVIVAKSIATYLFKIIDGYVSDSNGMMRSLSKCVMDVCTQIQNLYPKE